MILPESIVHLVDGSADAFEAGAQGLADRYGATIWVGVDGNAGGRDLNLLFPIAPQCFADCGDRTAPHEAADPMRLHELVAIPFSPPFIRQLSVAFPKERIHSRLVNTFGHFAREQFAAAEARENEVAAGD